MFQSVWFRITDWFIRTNERRKLLTSFNLSAKRAYVHGFTLTLIEARISVGESRFRHEFSKFLAGGFRIKALTGRPLLREEQMQIGLAILSNDDLVRELVTLGWDTLEVHDSVGKQGLKWELKKYTNIGGVLSCGEE